MSEFVSDNTKKNFSGSSYTGGGMSSSDGAEIKLSSRPELRQHFSYELLQSVELLELTNIELAARIQTELEKNPVLELEEEEEAEDEIDIETPKEDEEDEFEEKKSEEISSENTPDKKEEDYDSAADKSLSPEAEAEKELADNELEEYFSNASDIGYLSNSSFEEVDSFENFTPSRISLFSKLQEQLLMVLNNTKDYKTAIYLISSITDKGFLNVSVEAAADYCRASVEYINMIRDIIMFLEPIGVCSLNIREFLLFQIQNSAKISYWTKIIIEQYFDFFQKHKMDEIARRLKINMRAIQACVNEIAALIPFPAYAYDDKSSDNYHYITPEIIYKKVSDEWQIIMNNDNMPYLRISSYYKNLVMSGGLGREEKNFIKGHINSAQNLIKAINRRQVTMYRVADRILHRQRDFFEKGILGLKPMILRDVADDLKLHETTISRCTRDKYCQTPFGIFELKFFFTSGLSTTDGLKISNAVIKEKMKSMLSVEDNSNPLNDTDIWKELIRDGLMVDRKTISNYREELGVLPRHLRRKIYHDGQMPEKEIIHEKTRKIQGPKESGKLSYKKKLYRELIRQRAARLSSDS